MSTWRIARRTGCTSGTTKNYNVSPLLDRVFPSSSV
jgi:hypothetical protein